MSYANPSKQAIAFWFLDALYEHPEKCRKGRSQSEAESYASVVLASQMRLGLPQALVFVRNWFAARGNVANFTVKMPIV